MRRTVAVLAALLLLATSGVSSSAGAQAPTSVTGRLVDEDGRPVNSLDVVDLGGASTTTGSDGRFTLEVSPGTVTLSLWDNDFQQFGFDGELVVTAAAGSTTDIGTRVLRSVPNPTTSSAAIDTGSRASVRAAYRQLRKAMRPVRSPSPHGCRVAATPAKAQRRAMTVVNVVRRMSGLDPVTLDARLSKRAQKAALIQYYQGYLSHYPSRHARCATAKGVAASGRSNLALGYGSSAAMMAYVSDPGANNTAAGHRRWIQNPYAEAMGTGQVGTANALYVVGPTAQDNPTPRALSWPTPGFFPAQLEPAGRWSFSMTRQYDVSLASARVRATTDGRRLRLHRYPPSVGYGYQTTLVWDFRSPLAVPAHGTRTVRVTVSGMTQRGLPLPVVTYDVRLFRA